MDNDNLFSIKILFSVLFCCNIALADTGNNIEISGQWISEAPPTISIMAGYLNLKNNSTKTVTLLKASSPDFAKIEFHRGLTKGDMVSMEKQLSLEIPAGEMLDLSPGGYHLMLFGPEKSLRAGETTIINFLFADGHEQTINVTVKKRHTNDNHSQHH